MYKLLPILVIGFLLASCVQPFDPDPIDEFQCGDAVTDIEGNTYNTVQIGSQCWFADNLRTARYRNGDPILTEWGIIGQGAWINYDNRPELGAIYGKLYNWYAIDDSRQVCPVGWHVPSHQEWYVITTYLGENDGGKMKTTGTEYWLSPNTGATNESGFNGLPGGSYNYTRGFFSMGEQGSWWSTSHDQSAGDAAMMRYLNHHISNVRQFVVSFDMGYSVRCVID